MVPSCLAILACPDCHDEDLLITIQQSIDGHIWRGYLICSHCNRSFPILDGIPSFIEISNNQFEDDFGGLTTSNIRSLGYEQQGAFLQAAERAYRDKHSGEYEASFDPWVNTVEIASVLDDLEVRKSDVVLDLGCGTGRSLRPLIGRCRIVVGLDYSLTSLQLLQRSLSIRRVTSAVHLIHADARRLPLRASAFDRAVSLQLIEHISEPSERLVVISEVARVLKDHGRLVLTLFHYSLLKRVRGPRLRDPASEVYEREGLHKGLLYYYNFTVHDSRDLLRAHFTILSTRGVVTPLIRRFPSTIVSRVERRLSKTPIAFLAAHLLEITANKKLEKEC